MRAADVMVFPRLEEPKEGLGLVVVEAQGAGLPTLTSFGVLDDAIVLPELVRRIPLASGPAAWAREALTILREGRGDASAAREAVSGSRFSMDRSARGLLALYE
jgi:glycosyltransferase involved in cell wall biosynthesis